MRVLLVPYPGTWALEGGHRTQELQTASALRRAGCDVAIGDLATAFGGRFDVVHFFGDPAPLVELGRPGCRLFVVTPIYFPLRVRDGRYPWGTGQRAAWSTMARRLTSPLRHRGAAAEQRSRHAAEFRALGSADLLIVNSDAEAQMLHGDWFGSVPVPAVRVAHSGVGDAFFNGDAVDGAAIVGTQDFVLCVGRIEPRKNQLGLCQAMAGIDAPLVLTGDVLPGNEGYLEACMAALPGCIHIDHIDHERLPGVYAAARAHALISWFETTGLATLEALAAGTPAVAADTPCVREYFAAGARLVPPGSLKEVRRSLRASLDGPIGSEREVARRYSWDQTAQDLIAAYSSVGG